LKGPPLLALQKELRGDSVEEGMLGAALLQELLLRCESAEDAACLSGKPTKWWAADEYGSVLKQLLEGNVVSE